MAWSTALESTILGQPELVLIIKILITQEKFSSTMFIVL